MNKQPFVYKPGNFKPLANRACLCGSGLKFKRCCSDHLPREYNSKAVVQALNNDDYKKALIECRADITQYTIWIKSHTEPVILTENIKYLPPEFSFDYLIEIDVNALSVSVNNLIKIYLLLKLEDEIHYCLDNLRDNIKHEKWQRKIAYFHVIASLGLNWNEEAGRKEFKRLGSIKNDTDVELIQLYIDLFGETISFADLQVYIDKILKLNKSPGNILHYKGLKAKELLCIGDLKGAADTFRDSIEEFKSKKSLDSASDYELTYLAYATELLGSLSNDKSILEESLIIYNKLLNMDYFKPVARSEYFRHIGETYKQLNDYNNALNAFEDAYATFPKELHRVFIAECKAILNESTEATNIINSIEIEKLSKNEYSDFAFIYAGIALKSGTKDNLEKAEAHLDKVENQEPYFNDIKNQLLLNVLKAKTENIKGPMLKKLFKMISNITSASGKYLILQPNFMGLGVNIENIIKAAHSEDNNTSDD